MTPNDLAVLIRTSGMLNTLLSVQNSGINLRMRKTSVDLFEVAAARVNITAAPRSAPNTRFFISILLFLFVECNVEPTNSCLTAKINRKFAAGKFVGLIRLLSFALRLAKPQYPQLWLR